MKCGRGFGRGIAGGEVGDHAVAVLALEVLEKLLDASHALSKFLQVFAIDIDVFVASSGEIDDEGLAR